MKRFAGKSVLLTGGGGGIGGAIAARLGAEGGDIAVLDRNENAARDVAAAVERAGGRAFPVTADITDPASMERAVRATKDAHGRIDVLVNNAAFALKGDIDDTTNEDWRTEIDANLSGHYIASKAALPEMLSDGGGAIVNIGSVNGLMALGNPGYSAAKAGLLSLTQSLATEYGRRGIRANMISPGTIETDIETWRIRRAKNPQIFEQLARWYSVGRVGQPDDIASAVAYLASDDAAFVNGANLVVDGGLTAGLPVMIEEMILE